MTTSCLTSLNPACAWRAGRSVEATNAATSAGAATIATVSLLSLSLITTPSRLGGDLPALDVLDREARVGALVGQEDGVVGDVAAGRAAGRLASGGVARARFGAIESLGLGSRAIESLGLAGVAEAVGAVLVPAVAAGADDPAPPHAVTTRPRTGIMTSRRRLLVEVGCIWRDLALAVPESVRPISASYRSWR